MPGITLFIALGAFPNCEIQLTTLRLSFIPFFIFLGEGVAHEMEDDKPRKSQKDDEEQIAKYREILQSIQEKEKKQEEKDIEMEIKWVPGRL